MKRVTKGALAMVLAGSVTFSVANAMLDNSLTKQLVKENPFRITADRKKADIINKAAKKNIAEKPTTNGKDHEIAAVQASSKNSNQQNIEKSSSRTTTSAANTNVNTTPKPVKSTKAPTTTSKSTTTRTAATSATTKPAVTTRPATSTKAPTTSKPVTTTPTKTTTTTTTTTNTNRGQQVAQEAKATAESRRDTKVNNGKKM